MAARQQIVIDIQGRASGLTSALKSGQVELAKFNQQVQAATLASANNANATIQLRNAQGQYTTVVKQARVVAEQLRKEKAAMLAIESQLTAALTKEEQALLRNAGLMQNLSGATGSASFAVLSLGQGFQDAGQFGVGMAQGIRAVTNNAQQAFQALIFLRQQTGSTGKALTAFRTAMMGPAGLLLAFGAVTAAVEFFSNRMQQAASRTKKLKEETEGYIKAASGTVSIGSILSEFEVGAEQAAQAAIFLTEKVRQLEEEQNALSRSLQLGDFKDNERLIKRLTAAREVLIGVVKDHQTELRAEQVLRDAGLGDLIDEIRRLQRIQEEYDRLTKTVREFSRTYQIMIAGLRAAQASFPRGVDGALAEVGENRVSNLIRAQQGGVIQEGGRRSDVVAGLQIQTDELRRLAPEAAAAADEYLASMNGFKAGAEQLDATTQRLAVGFIQSLASIGGGFDNFKSTFGNFLQLFGTELIKMGIATEALAAALKGIQAALASLNPFAAIGAGAALIAAGAALRRQGRSSSRALGGGDVGQYSSGVGSAPNFISPRVSPAPLLAGIGSGGQQVVIQGEFVQRGRDLVAVVNSETRFQRDVGFNR